MKSQAVLARRNPAAVIGFEAYSMLGLVWVNTFDAYRVKVTEGRKELRGIGLARRCPARRRLEGLVGIGGLGRHGETRRLRLQQTPGRCAQGWRSPGPSGAGSQIFCRLLDQLISKLNHILTE